MSFKFNLFDLECEECPRMHLAYAGLRFNFDYYYADMAGGASTTGGELTTDGLPTITNQGELAPSMGSSSSSRRSSDPLSSEPGTPTQPPTLQNLHHLQVSCLCANSKCVTPAECLHCLLPAAVTAPCFVITIAVWCCLLVSPSVFLADVQMHSLTQIRFIHKH